MCVPDYQIEAVVIGDREVCDGIEWKEDVEWAVALHQRTGNEKKKKKKKIVRITKSELKEESYPFGSFRIL